MSINNLPGRIKFNHTDEILTNNVSLLAPHGLAKKQFGLIDDLDTAFHSYSSNRAYQDFKYPYLQILSHAAGGIGIEETRKISADLPLGRLLFPEQARQFDEHPERTESYLPAPNTLGDWYRQARTRHAHRARKINRKLCARIINNRRPQSIHIDIDAKMHASDNKKARRNRNGIKGYAPLYATIPDMKLVLDPLFRPGDAHPASQNASMTRTILNWLEHIHCEQVNITIDNAGCQVEVMKAVQRANRRSEKQIHVYTRPSSPDETIPKKMHKSITEAGDNWKPIEIYHNDNNRKSYRYLTEKEQKQRTQEDPPAQILDADYTLTSDTDACHGRLILVREPFDKKKAQKSFANGWRYYPVLTNDWAGDPIDIPGQYNQRGAGEDVISEIVQEGEAERFPCEEDEGNALYLPLISMGHNLDQAMKMVTDETFQRTFEESEQEEGDVSTDQQEQPKREIKQPAHQETAQLLSNDANTETSWLQFTIRKFKHLLLSIPARITSRSRYRRINISSHDPFGQLLEAVIRACWNPIHFESARDPT